MTRLILFTLFIGLIPGQAGSYIRVPAIQVEAVQPDGDPLKEYRDWVLLNFIRRVRKGS